MRAREFISESSIDRMKPEEAYPLPATYAIPALKNQDPYLQYRFGVAIAAAKGEKQRAQDGIQRPSAASDFGENEIVVSFDPHVGEYIDAALHTMGLSSSDKKLISTKTSQEPPSTNTTSPLPGFKGYPTKRNKNVST